MEQFYDSDSVLAGPNLYNCEASEVGRALELLPIIIATLHASQARPWQMLFILTIPHRMSLTAKYDTYGFLLRLCIEAAQVRNRDYEARSDWIKYFGPVGQFDCCNPVNGKFSAVVLPMCKPDHLRLVAYVLKYRYLLHY
jgi:hypothetical protein